MNQRSRITRRRRFLASGAALAAAAASPSLWMRAARAQAQPVKVGFLC